MSTDPHQTSDQSPSPSDPAAHSAPTQIQPTKVIDKYELQGRLGAGGMGEVYRARDRMRPDRERAVKLMRPHLANDAAARERFEREANIVLELNHPNIVRAFDAGHTETGEFYLVMELVQGMDLDQILRQQRSLPVSIACAIVHQVALGLQHIHEAGLVHRDIKPANLVISASGVVKILDLGLVKDNSESELTRTGATPGTPRYMSPEQFDSRPLDVRSDIYSLGCTFWHFLTGSAPFEGASYFELASAHVQKPLPDVRKILPELDPRIVGLLEGMLEKDPARRPSHPHEIAELLLEFACRTEDLKRFVSQLRSGENVIEPAARTSSMGRRSTAERTTKRGSGASRRLRKPWLAAGLAAAVLLGSVPFMLWRGPAREQIALQSLPGLHGNWWFEETPWLIPALRTEVGQAMPREVAEMLHSEDTEIFGERLLKLAGECRNRPAYVPADFWKSDSKDRSGRSTHRFTETQWKQLENSLAAFAREGRAGPADLHLLAVLKHHYGEPDASEAFDRAAASYGESAASRGLRALCMLDAARCRFDHSKWDEAAGLAEAAASTVSAEDGRLLKLSAHLFAADAKLQKGSSESEIQSSIDDAERSVGDLPTSHPLCGWLNEKTAWLRLERLRLKEADEKFDLAAPIYKSRENDLMATVHLLHVRHGKALVQRFARTDGEKPAIELYRDLRSEIEAALKSTAAAGGTPPSPLVERLFNTTDRLADCVLFDVDSTAADAKLMRKTLGETLNSPFRAAMHADAGRSASDRLLIREVLLSLCVDGGDLLEANEKLNPLRSRYLKRRSAEESSVEDYRAFTDMELACRIADALLDLASDSPLPAQATEPKKNLPQVRLGWNAAADRLSSLFKLDAATIRRDQMELLLLASRRWCELAANRPAADLETAASALQNVLESTAARTAAAPEYMRQHLDCAISAWSLLPDRTQKIASLMRGFNGVGFAGPAGRATVLFHFPGTCRFARDSTKSGCLLIVDPDGKERLTRISTSREDVLRGRIADRDTVLAESLASLGRKSVDVYWSRCGRGLTEVHFDKVVKAGFAAGADPIPH